ncbi:MAG: hypothetical protein CMO01_04830 [Thalassobius sp.]|nr:hypothetical protein [Thalassovita sp.]
MPGLDAGQADPSGMQMKEMSVGEKQQVREEVWALISAQVADLRSVMRARGLQSAKAEYSLEDGIAGLDEVAFRTGVATDISGRDITDIPMPDDICLGRSASTADGGATWRESLHVSEAGGETASLQDAAAQVIENISDYVLVTLEEGRTVDGLDIEIGTEYGLRVRLEGPEEVPWDVPDQTETMEDLEDWMGRQLEALEASLHDRFASIAQVFVDDLATRWPDLHPSVTWGNGGMFVRTGAPGVAIDLLNNWLYEDMEERWPGLSEEIDAMDDRLDRLDALWIMPACGPLTPSPGTDPEVHTDTPDGP